jgi:lipopolysaccharide transport system ATP-binding protein
VTVAISLRGLHKAYRVYNHPRDMMLEVLTGRQRHRDFVALDDVSFDVHPGEVVGLMGRNGAGKSTLLRIVAGTLDATGGVVDTRGRIAAILELGTGFHPEYSGRENVYLGGLCLGLSRSEIDRRFDEIVAFSELEAFIDQPFRTYSTGMQARLTFSVATCVDPDILIIDEALSVGDARFQLKSFDRIREFKRRGKSILVVSHSINQIVGICDRAILLERGKVVVDDEPNKVGQVYHELLFGSQQAGAVTAPPMERTESQEPRPPDLDATGSEPKPSSGDKGVTEAPAAAPAWLGTRAGRQHRYGDGRAQIVSLKIADADGRSVVQLESGGTYWIGAVVAAFDDIDDLCCGVLIRDARGLDIFASDNSIGKKPMLLPAMRRGEEVAIRIRIRANLSAGSYFLTAAIARSDGTKHDVQFDALEFVVSPTPFLYATSIANLEPEFLLLQAPAARSDRDREKCESL